MFKSFLAIYSSKYIQRMIYKNHIVERERGIDFVIKVRINDIINRCNNFKLCKICRFSQSILLRKSFVYHYINYL